MTEKVVQSGEVISQAAGAHSMSVLSLILDASWVVQLVMLILMLALFFTCYIIVLKWRSLGREARLAKQFEREFWAGGSMEKLYESWGPGNKKSCGMSELFTAGYREYLRLLQTGFVNSNDVLDAVNRAMKVELGREIDHLESHIPFLATVGSISPYIGLFGTVIGIMNSFIGLGQSTQQATIATVAPGIAEALIATAMGLMAAIPAVVAYNRYSHNVERLVGQYEIFTEEFLSIVNRQIASDKD
ncbi:MAG: protein TolQ [Arenicella sp.]